MYGVSYYTVCVDVCVCVCVCVCASVCQPYVCVCTCMCILCRFFLLGLVDVKTKAQVVVYYRSQEEYHY